MRLGFGLALLILGAAIVLAGRRRLRLWHVLHALAESTPDELVEQARAGRLGPSLFAVVGLAAPGPGGPLVSTVNSEPCVWHRHTVHHRQTRWRTDAAGRTHRRTTRRRVGDVASAEPFHLAGVRGRIEVRPANMRVDRPERGRVRVLPGIASQPFPEETALMGAVQNSYRHREWTVRAGTALYVVGEAIGEGTLVVLRRPARGPHLISTRGAAALRERLRRFAAAGLALGALVGSAGVALITTALITTALV